MKIVLKLVYFFPSKNTVRFCRAQYGFAVHVFQMICYILFLAAITLLVVMYPNCIMAKTEPHVDYHVDYQRHNDSYNCFNYGSPDIVNKHNYEINLSKEKKIFTNLQKQNFTVKLKYINLLIF